MEIIIFLGISLLIYFFPTVVAVMRSHKNTLAIGLLNLFLGWTLLGWVGALIWSATNQNKV